MRKGEGIEGLEEDCADSEVGEAALVDTLTSNIVITSAGQGTAIDDAMSSALGMRTNDESRLARTALAGCSFISITSV